MPHPRLFYEKVLSKSLVLESKIENKNDDGKVDKVGDRTGTEGPFLAVHIFSVKSSTMYLLSIIPGL